MVDTKVIGPETKVMIAVPTAEMARRADFYDYYNRMIKPIGTILINAHGQSPARNRNVMIKEGIKHECTHIMFLDDDVAFQPDLLMRLLAHEKDIVGGLYFMRSHPHKPIIFDYADEQGRCRNHLLEHDEKGLIEVVAMGLGCCVIKVDVFKNMEEPWIRLGELEPDHWCDDLGFFKRARDKGYKIFCDLDAMVGHMAQVTIWPTKTDGKWYSTYDTNGSATASLPQLTVEDREKALALESGGGGE